MCCMFQDLDYLSLLRGYSWTYSRKSDASSSSMSVSACTWGGTDWWGLLLKHRWGRAGMHGLHGKLLVLYSENKWKLSHIKWRYSTLWFPYHVNGSLIPFSLGHNTPTESDLLVLTMNRAFNNRTSKTRNLFLSRPLLWLADMIITRVGQKIYNWPWTKSNWYLGELQFFWIGSVHVFFVHLSCPLLIISWLKINVIMQMFAHPALQYTFGPHILFPQLTSCWFFWIFCSA